jgi:hypothetical protein
MSPNQKEWSLQETYKFLHLSFILHTSNGSIYISSADKAKNKTNETDSFS